MAEFSKQYDQEFDLGWYDFDYEEIFSNLKENQVYPLICAGLGTLAVAKSDGGEILFAIQSEEDPEMVEWKNLQSVIELVKSAGK